MRHSTNVPRARSAGQLYVEVKAVTWNKDSHGLFDYENAYYDMKKFQLFNSMSLYRQNNEVHARQRQGMEIENEQGSELLLTVTKRENGPDRFYIDITGLDGQGAISRRPSYLIVRSLKCSDGRNQRGYHLQTGDVMKLGRIEYKVIEIRTNQGCSSILNTVEEGDPQSRQIFDADACAVLQQKKDKGEMIICKYCLMDSVPEATDDLSNLMLYICDCYEGVHYHCLKVWMQYKIISKSTQNVTSYQWKKLDCEICLKQWPKRIKFKNTVHELITLNRPAGPYMILERPSSDANTASTMNIITPTDNQPVKMGRGHQCDLRISDISVSRIHTHVKFENDKFLVFDNDSKFGTLILLNKDYQVKHEKAAIQIGRTVFTFVLKSPITETPTQQNTSQFMGPQAGV